MFIFRHIVIFLLKYRTKHIESRPTSTGHIHNIVIWGTNTVTHTSNHHLKHPYSCKYYLRKYWKELSTFVRSRKHVTFKYYLNVVDPVHLKWTNVTYIFTFMPLTVNCSCYSIYSVILGSLNTRKLICLLADIIFRQNVFQTLQHNSESRVLFQDDQ